MAAPCERELAAVLRRLHAQSQGPAHSSATGGEEGAELESEADSSRAGSTTEPVSRTALDATGLEATAFAGI